MTARDIASEFAAGGRTFDGQISHGLGGCDEGATPRGKLSAHQIAHIDEYLNAQIDSPLSLATMAQLVDLSPQAFHRAFKATVGVPPLRYSLQLRMRRARDLVEGTTQPIGEIGMAVGFPDLAHFTNTFRKHWGAAPTRLRRG